MVPLESKDVPDNPDMFPESPYYGPDTTCPKCGVRNLYYKTDSFAYNRKAGDLHTRRVTKAIFCGPGQRIRLRWWPWPKKCKHPGCHLHQKCLTCGAHFVSKPLSEKPNDK